MLLVGDRGEPGAGRGFLPFSRGAGTPPGPAGSAAASARSAPLWPLGPAAGGPRPSRVGGLSRPTLPPSQQLLLSQPRALVRASAACQALSRSLQIFPHRSRGQVHLEWCSSLPPAPGTDLDSTVWPGAKCLACPLGSPRSSGSDEVFKFNRQELGIKSIY